VAGKFLNLPDTYYRVSIKALVFDDKQRLLVFKEKRGEWEIPGGGWNHAESFEACVRRELGEEVGAEVRSISDIRFVYKAETEHRNPKINLVVEVTLGDGTLRPAGDDLVETRYVSREEFMSLKFQRSEAAAQDYADKIWQ
jgi:8-oxo-dGTP diphosphatase